ncbi:Tubulin-specific chaperone cofactor E-like protein [Schistosoma japonicum]|nr:Tubulin-specific chaperone cofactor E-like protein [Schistosoma japonicum]
MTSLVEAIQRKQEKLTESHIFVGHIQRACVRDGSNIIFPTRTLTMDCQDIDSIGCKDELLKAAEDVKELDLACNRLSSFEEVFKLLCWLEKLESLNLSQNPLGYHEITNHQSCNSSFDEDTIVSLSTEGEENIQSVVHSNSFQNHDCFSYDKSSSESNKILQSKHSEINFSSIFHHTEFTNNGSLQKLKSFHSDGGSYIKQQTENEVSTMKISKQLSTPSELALNSGIISSTTRFPCLNVLALNSTYIPWNWVIDLLHRLPNLTDLHVARNNYGAEEEENNSSYNANNDDYITNALPVFPHLRSLYYSDNGITNWWTICRLCKHFPGLEQLILLGNPIEYIPFPLSRKQQHLHTSQHTASTTNNSNELINEDNANAKSFSQQSVCNNNNQLNNGYHQCIFKNVHTLGLSETLISQWESIDALDEWMPSLTNLRLGNTLPLFQSWIEPECRAHVIARLPKLTTYNRSVIDSVERESAEREFVRHFGQLDSDQRPNRYWELERRHGHLEPLANIDLSPKRYIRVRVTMSGKEIWYDLNVNLKVSQVKRQFCNLFNIHYSQHEIKRYKLFYFDQVMSQIQGPEELKYPNRNLYSYQVESGDLFELVQYPNY